MADTQTNIKSDQKPTTSNRYKPLTDELVDDGMTFHQPGTVAEGKSTNQRPTWTTDATNTTKTDSSVFIRKLVVVCITVDSQSKTKDRKSCSPKYKVFRPTIEPDKKNKMLYAPFILKRTKLTHFWTLEQSKVQYRKSNFEK